MPTIYTEFSGVNQIGDNKKISASREPPSAVCVTHIGRRLNHEDNFLFQGRYLTAARQKAMSDKRSLLISSNAGAKAGLFAISDGMGGHNAGEVASRVCVEKLAALEKTVQTCSSVKEAVHCVQTGIAEINTAVCEMSHRHKEWNGMGATLVLLIVCGADCAILNVGDSRAYYFNGSTLVQITKDHTEGQRMLDLGLLTRKELAGFPAKKYLNRYIGYDQEGFLLRADEYYPVLEGGVLLLCSDGVSDALSDSRISDILCSEHALKRAGKRLMEEAAATEHADNATAILIPLRR